MEMIISMVYTIICIGFVICSYLKFNKYLNKEEIIEREDKELQQSINAEIAYSKKYAKENSRVSEFITICLCVLVNIILIFLSNFSIRLRCFTVFYLGLLAVIAVAFIPVAYLLLKGLEKNRIALGCAPVALYVAAIYYLPSYVSKLDIIKQIGEKDYLTIPYFVMLLVAVILHAVIITCNGRHRRNLCQTGQRIGWRMFKQGLDNQ